MSPRLLPLILLTASLTTARADIGLGAKPLPGAEVIIDGTRPHGMAAVINEAAPPIDAYNGTGKWNSYDITFRAARFQDGKRTEKALVTIYFNGKKIHANQSISQVWGGPKSGVDGGNDGG